MSCCARLMRHHPPRATLAFSLVVLAACAEGSGGRRGDAGAERDATVVYLLDSSSDGSTSLPDMGEPRETDTGTTDTDSGTATDTGTDTGTATDTGTDTGTTTDAGSDAGADAGTDAGVDAARDAGTDAEPACESPCRLVEPQCGCEGGNACRALAGIGRFCTGVGAELEGEACAATNTCKAGLQCINQGAPGVNMCERFCNTDADCIAGEGSLCKYVINDGTGMPIPGANLCTFTCDLADGEGCNVGTGCTLLIESTGLNRRYTHCLIRDELAEEFDDCTLQTDCASGFGCIPIGSEINACLRFCHRATGAECDLDQECGAFVMPVVIDDEEFGVCIPL